MAASTPPPEVQGYIRHPTVCGKRIAFIAEEDLWTVDVDGGSCLRRLTTGLGASHPLFSKDGKYIAFTIGSDVWVLTLADGCYRQLTFFGWGNTQAVAWIEGKDGDYEVVVAATFSDAFGRRQLQKASLSGSGVHKLYSAEQDAMFEVGSEGGMIVGRNTLDHIGTNGAWKGYRGGQYGRLWFSEDGGGTFRTIDVPNTSTNAPAGTQIGVVCPMWVKDKIWFIADHDGSANLWSMNVKGEGLVKHTNHDFFDVRCAQSDGSSIVYVHVGELWLLESDKPARRVSVEFSAPTSRIPRFFPGDDCCSDLILHPEAHHCAMLCRGQVFEMALWEGPAVQSVSTKPVNGRAVRCLAFEYLWSGRLLTITDENAPLPSFTIHPRPRFPDNAPEKADEWLSLLIADTGAAAQCVTLSSDFDIGQIVELCCSPKHDAAIITTARNELLLVEFVTEDGDRPNPQTDPFAKSDTAVLRAECKVLDKSEFLDGVCDVCWSPDAEWIAYARKDSTNGAAIVLLCLETGEKTVVSDSSFENCEPSFQPDGLLMSFFSARTFRPKEDLISQDMMFSSAFQLPYLVLLKKDSPNPFQLTAKSPAVIAKEAEDDDEEEEEEDDNEDEEEDEEAEEPAFVPPEKIEIDLEGIQDRILAFPVAPGRYWGGQWAKGGKFLYVRGADAKPKVLNVEDEEDEDDESGALCIYEFKKRKEMELATEIIDFEVSLDLKNMLLHADKGDDEDEYRVHVAAQKPPQSEDDDEDLDLEKPGPESGTLDLSRVNLQVVPIEEWREVFNEIRHHVAENYFDEACGGIDWKGTCNRYEEILPRLRSRTELTDLCTELLAELGCSHVSLSDPADEEEEGGNMVGKQSHLGGQFSWQEFESGGGYRVDSLVKGDTWDSSFSGPLGRPCIGVTEGSLIIAVNRTRVCKAISIAQMLVNCGGSEVFLTFVPPESLENFEKVQGLLAKSGGADGFRRLCASQRKTLKEKNKENKSGDKKKSKNSKGDLTAKDKGKKSSGKDTTEADIEQILSDMLSKAGIDVTEGPIWKTVRVRPYDETVADNSAMRDYVERAGKAVHEATSGQVGYLRVPDCEIIGYAEFYRYYTRECEYKALIVDLRCNAGGYISSLVMKKLREQPLAWDVPRQGRHRPTLCPWLCPSRNLILLCDENSCSDAECWTEYFQRAKLGKVVGMRTWGGVVSIGNANLELLDGATVVIPAEHYYALDGCGYGLENFGAVPDVVVDWPPDAKEEDPQLAEGIRQAMKMLETSNDKVEIPPVPKGRLHRLDRK